MTEPLFRVVRGTPSPEELAALTAVILAAASGDGDSAPTPASPWSARVTQTRRPLDPGPGAWRASGLPH
ncbi:acyl-CoA carboxylase subunit epsilon [Actinokineospora fastidiosa]|uniref:Acetyl-CoA carboxylase biotin carboxyl carrier protein subunit n=1 Tax=Actinokineospora fastidiosa TaxID=1816 RepID=A0A918GA53_9PSEU|nr:acyl-CoA carboxylase subunit epsilon [Actinokineospora fastidiosa]GGS25097.1 acetyl-CoA carboxylase biotin carboxyl carrier protein subunit [Actinokineospora fastidiosa]